MTVYRSHGLPAYTISLALNRLKLIYYRGYMKRPDDAGQSTPDSKLDQPASGPSPLKQLRIGQALLATTWRIVVPVVLFTGLGIFLDLRFGSKPWLTLLGVVIGFVLAGKLIARLLKETEDLS
jgi:hypothetical protein